MNESSKCFTRQRTISSLLVLCSLAFHVGIGGFFAFRTWSTIDPVIPPPVSVSFSSPSVYLIPMPPPPSPPGPRTVKPPPESSPGNYPPKPPPIPLDPNFSSLPSMPDQLRNSDGNFSIDSNLTGESSNPGNDTGIVGVNGGDGDFSDWLPEPRQIFKPYNASMKKPKAIFTPVPEYPSLARTAGVRCSMVINAWIDRSGRVVNIEVKSPCEIFSDLFTQAVYTALPQWRFEPATLNDIPVAVQYTLTIRFIFSYIEPIA